MHISTSPEPGSVKQGICALLDDNPVAGAPKSGAKRFWTNVELKIIRANYATLGVEGLLPLLPGRTAASIYNRAGIEKLLKNDRSGRPGEPRKKYPESPEIDRVIKAAFERKKTSKDEFKKLARTVGRPYRWVMARGARLTNTKAPRFKELPWSKAELDIAETHAHLGDAALQRRLARAGFTRTKTAIHVKLVRLQASREDPDHYTALGLAKLLGVDGKTVTLWIEKGYLNADRRGTARGTAQGGDQHWIHWKAAKRLIVENANLIDLRKVDRTWFIDLLGARRD